MKLIALQFLAKDYQPYYIYISNEYFPNLNKIEITFFLLIIQISILSHYISF